MNAEDDFYEEDETEEERRAAWKKGERGVTTGSRRLDERSQRIVDEIAARWDKGV